MAPDRYPTSRPRPGGPRPGGDRGGYSAPDRTNFPPGDRSSHDRPGFSPGPRTFTPRPAPAAEPAAPHSIRVRDGDREIEVSGSPAFVRQAIDDLPDLLARLRGERKGGPAVASSPQSTRSISMPAPSPAPAPHPVTEASAANQGNGATAANGAVTGGARVSPAEASPLSGTKTPRAKRHAAAHSLEEQVIGILAGQKRPVTVAAIRKRLSDDVSGQLVRRTLERSDRVSATSDRPAAYRLR